MNVPHLQLGISDAALIAASEETEWRGRTAPSPQVCRLPAWVRWLRSFTAEMVAGFPSGRLFLDSIEQAMAVALVSGQAVRYSSCADIPLLD